MGDCFAITVSGEEVAAGKPAPDVYLAATRRLGVDPDDAVAVEDSTNGLRAAAADRQSQPRVPTRARRAGAGGAGRRVLDELMPDAIESAAQRARKR